MAIQVRYDTINSRSRIGDDHMSNFPPFQRSVTDLVSSSCATMDKALVFNEPSRGFTIRDRQAENMIEKEARERCNYEYQRNRLRLNGIARKTSIFIFIFFFFFIYTSHFD